MELLDVIKKAIDEKKGEHVIKYDFRSLNPVRSMEGNHDSRWVLVDLDSVVVHVFLEEERKHFQLEKLYADLPCEDFTL